MNHALAEFGSFLSFSFPLARHLSLAQCVTWSLVNGLANGLLFCSITTVRAAALCLKDRDHKNCSKVSHKLLQNFSSPFLVFISNFGHCWPQMIFLENRTSFMAKHRLKWLYSVGKTIWNNFRIRSMNLVHCGLHCWFCASALCEIKTPSDFICLAVPSVHTFRVQGVYVQDD